MRIGAVVVCVNYGDILAWTLKENKPFFERLIVVTSPNDEQTKQVCDYFHVRCEMTSAFYMDNRGVVDVMAFNKAAAINHGLRCLEEEKPTPEDWYLHMDADMALPPRTRELLQRADLDPSGIYGIDRMMVTSFADYIAHLSLPMPHYSQQTFIHLDHFPMGTRIAKMDDGEDGFVPIGFFQLWNPAKSGVVSYPTDHVNCARSDMLFAQQWPRKQRHLIPEVVGLHLESENAVKGANWDGRTTQPFGPTVALQSARRPQHRPYRGRGHHGRD